MKFKRAELLEALERAKGSVATGDIIPMLGCYRFTPDRIETTNMEIGASVSFETGLDCTVPAEKLYKLVSMLRQDEIDMTVKDGKLIVKAEGHRSSTAVTGDNDDFPVVMVGKRSWKKTPTDFMDALKACLPGVSDDIAMPKLCGVYLDGRDAVSTDRWRVYHYTMKSKMHFAALWPTELVKEVVKWGEPDGIEFATHSGDSDSEDTIYLKYGDDLLMGRLRDAKFPPKWKDMFPKDVEMHEFPGTEMKGALERMGAFSDESEGIGVSFEKGNICLSYRSVEFEMEETIGFKDIDGVSFNAKPNLFASVIGNDMRIGFAETDMPIVYLESGDNFRCVLACIKNDKENDEQEAERDSQGA